MTLVVLLVLYSASQQKVNGGWKYQVSFLGDN